MAGNIPRTFIDEILTRTDIVELIDQRVSLRKSGTNFSACCPFHNEKTPSFSVNPKRQFYYCFGCGKGGNAISFLIEHDRLSFVEAVEQLAGLQGLAVPYENNSPLKKAPKKEETHNLYELMAKACDYYIQQLQASSKAQQYLAKRDLTPGIIKRFKIGFAPPGWENIINHCGKQYESLNKAGMVIQKEEGGYYDRFRDRIMFPIHNRQGQIIGFGGRTLGDDTPKYLNSPETPIFHKRSELFGLYEAQQAMRDFENILVVEGYMDVIALAQYGINNCVATLGTATSPQHLQKLYRYTDTIIFCFDGDGAGKKAAWRALENLLPIFQDGHQARFMFLPEKEDPDTMVRKVGKDGFEETVSKAMPLSEFFFQQLKSQSKDLQSLDGRSQLAKAALELLDKLPSGVFQQMMLEKLSNITRTEPETLRRLATNNQPPEQAPVRQESQPRRQRLNPSQLAIALLLQNPQIAQTVDNHDFLAKSRDPYCQVIQHIIDAFNNDENITTGSLLEAWRGHEFIDTLLQLAAWDTLIPDSGIASEFKGALQRLREQNIQTDIQALLAKGTSQPLTIDEKKQLQFLINLQKKDKIH